MMKRYLLLLALLLTGSFSQLKAQKALMSEDSLKSYLNGTWTGKEYHCWEAFDDTISRMLSINGSEVLVNERARGSTSRVLHGHYEMYPVTTVNYSLKTNLDRQSTSLRYNTLFLGDIVILGPDRFMANWYEALYINGKQGDLYYLGAVIFERALLPVE